VLLVRHLESQPPPCPRCESIVFEVNMLAHPEWRQCPGCNRWLPVGRGVRQTRRIPPVTSTVMSRERTSNPCHRRTDERAASDQDSNLEPTDEESCVSLRDAT
jgi:hypothetical protein